jgi:hypothetical protein
MSIYIEREINALAREWRAASIYRRVQIDGEIAILRERLARARREETRERASGR